MNIFLNEYSGFLKMNIFSARVFWILRKWIVLLNKYSGLYLPTSKTIVAKWLKLIQNHSGVISGTYYSSFQGSLTHTGASWVALFDMPNLNWFDILSISIFCKIALSISIFSKITISISISISIFLELPYRYRYRYRYFSELPYRYRYRYRYFQLLHIDIDIDIDIFQKCRYIDNRYFISIF